MEIQTDSFCIIIASHLSNSKRIEYLSECLESLINQSIKIAIYLSISFENDTIKEEFFQHQTITKVDNKINMIIREQKTPQMRHIYLLNKEIKENKTNKKPCKWAMFCDDDDIYDKIRVEKIVQYIEGLNRQCSQYEDKICAGLYESTFGKDHREHRHEYWCYCINIELLNKFYERIEKFPDIIDNKCCDVLFAEYLRRSGPDYIFGRIEEKLYNYRVENNNDSITGFIKENQGKYTRFNEPPSLMDINFSEYVVDWNDCLYENMDVYLHDIFLRTIVGCDLDYILKAEFRADSALLSYVDKCHLENITEKHHYWRNVCNGLFDIPFTN